MFHISKREHTSTKRHLSGEYEKQYCQYQEQKGDKQSEATGQLFLLSATASEFAAINM